MKIILVDDNRYVLESLEVGVDYKALGIDTVYAATSAKEAMEILQTQEVDIVLTDIEMYGGTGIELLEWINKNRPHILTIFCTSYASFDYAKKAVELHCFDYYLKPIRFEEIQGILGRAIDEMHRRSQTEERAKLGDFWLSNLNENKKHFWTEAFLLIYTYSEEELGELSQSRHLPYRKGDRFTIGILKFSKENSRMQNMDFVLEQFALRNMLEEMLSTHGISLEAFFKSDFEAWILVLQCPVQGQAALTGILKEMVSRLEQAVKCDVGMYFYAEQVFEEIRSRYLELEQTFVNRYDGGSVVMEYREELFCAGQQKPEEIDIAVERIKSYIDGHFQEKITREDMGSGIFYNTAYLAKLFKKKYGQSMGAYLMERRLEKAKELLAADNRNVSEVAMAVGYDNFAYFSRLFRKKTGFAPKDYKQSHMG